MDPRFLRRSANPLPRRLLLLAAASAFVVVACSSAAAPFDDFGGPVTAPTAAPALDGNKAGELPASEGTAGSAPDAVPVRADRLIVRTGQLSLRVKDLDAVLAQVARGIEGLGGYVAASERSGQDENAMARVTYRVPAARWDDALVVARKAGDKVLAEQTSSTEVTDQVVDLGARLVNLRASEAALQEIMAKAVKIPDVLEVQAQLTAVREQIERLEAEKQNLEGQAALATLAVDFTLPPPVAVTTAQQGWDPAAEIDRAAATLVEMGQGAVNLGIWLAIVWLPVLVLVGLLGLVVYALVRRARRRPTVTPAAPPDVPADGPAA